MDGVLKVRRGGDLGPVLVPVLLPTACGSKIKSREHIIGDKTARCNGSNSIPCTFLGGKHGDDLVPGLLLLRHGR